MTELAQSLQRLYKLPHALVPADLLDLATAFRAGIDINSWGVLRLLQRWTERQPWRRGLPLSFENRVRI